MRPTAITFPWADGEFTFDLRLKEIRELQSKTGFGPAMILHRLKTEQWCVDDYRETILQGLLGAGMATPEARALVFKWVDERPAGENLIVAQAILMSLIVGSPTGKAKAAQTNSETRTAPADSTSPPSMASVPQ